MNRRALSCALVATGLTLVAAGAALATDRPPPRSFGDLPASVPAATPHPLPASTSSAPVAVAAKTAQAKVASTPQRIRIPAVSIDALITPSGIRTDRSLLLPAPAQVGWWIGGAVPGTAGNTVLAGHVDTTDGHRGALYALSSVHRGDPIRVDTATGSHLYRVVALRSYPRQQLPLSVFRRSGPTQLVLITCGGSYHAGHGYTDNTVVYASPTP